MERKTGISEVEAQLMNLTDLEKKLAESQELVEIRGKVHVFPDFLNFDV